ncbi:MAG: SET domain-containing protein-lysine N-methyltransferase [Aquabacterium sp.]|uniref:SET domain-containing protein n=1 Tax=Aquabacterium sp. TaxID=1872578 RepID=UPI002A35CAE0|nr:SET domain-containing protein-lysine N-methyltransferase [Aquabacterium sp.]MDX9843565.1 SET domain-containing protein-lysine N-methyltransferase [Aquabacterium sp.]
MPTLRPVTPAATTAPAPAVGAPASVPPESLAGPPGTAARGQPADPQKFKVTVGPSAIDGQGAFAGEAIPARRKIGEMRGEFVDMAEARRRARLAEQTSGRIFMVAISDKRAVDATHSTDPLRFANHSCQPNMVLKVQQGRVAFYALRDIAEGEELTARYGETHHAGRLTCRCGAPGCQGRL